MLEGFVPASVVACYYGLGERLVHVLSAVCLTVLSAIPYIGLRSLSTHPPSSWTSLHYTTRVSPAGLILFLPSSLPRFPVAYAGISFACPNHLPWASSSLFLVLASHPCYILGSIHYLVLSFLGKKIYRPVYKSMLLRIAWLDLFYFNIILLYQTQRREPAFQSFLQHCLVVLHRGRNGRFLLTSHDRIRLASGRTRRSDNTDITTRSH